MNALARILRTIWLDWTAPALHPEDMLKPCPWCHSRDIRVKYYPPDPLAYYDATVVERMWEIACHDCKGLMRRETMAEVREKWNTRPIYRPIDAMRKASIPSSGPNASGPSTSPNPEC